MMIGQIEVMKITKMAEGWPSRKPASEIGSQASGGTVRSTWKIGSSPRSAQVDWPDQHAEADADDHRQREAEGHALQAGEQVPEQALVDAAAVEERIEDQLPGVLHHLAGRRQGGARARAQHLPDAPAAGR